MSSHDIEVDLAVIGFGKGGKTLAGTLAARGRRVALIEQSSEMYGGTCINIGCVPSKALSWAASHPGTGTDPKEWFETAAERVSSLTAAMRAKNFQIFDSPETATVITGRASFIDATTLAVSAGEDELIVRAPTIIINTGAASALPPIPGLRESRHVVTSTEALALRQRPDHLIIVGGGYIGVEFATTHAAFGTRVTLIHRGERLLETQDADISQEVRELLEAAGVTVLTSAAASQILDVGDRVKVFHNDGAGHRHEVEGDMVLAALGRRPVTDGLNLAAAGIEVGERGEVVVDEYCRTSAPNVFAVGDVNGGPQFTYISLDDHRVVLDQLEGDGLRSTRDRVAVPSVVFTSPPLAHVGLTFAQAEASGRAVRTAVRRVADMVIVPRARIVQETLGVMKAVVDAETDQILGATLLAHDAHEVINTIALAMRAGATAADLRDGIWTHPSMTEAFNDLFGQLR